MSSYERDPTTGNLSLIDGMRSLDEVKALMLDLCYPIGSMYISTVDTSPQTFLGGTWIRHEGYVLRGATSGVTSNDATKTGGSDDAIVPYHRHYVERQLLAESAGSHSHGFYSQGGGATGQGWVAQAINGYTPDQSLETWSAGAHTHYISAHNTNYEGTSTTNANIPNYKSVYIWERTE